MMRIKPTIFLLAAAAVWWSGCASHRPSTTPEPTAESPEVSPKALDHFIQGVIYDQQGEITRAIGEYRQALKYDSTAASIYLALAEDYLTLKLYDDALEQLHAGLAYDSTNAEVLEFLSDLLMKLQMPECISKSH